MKRTPCRYRQQARCRFAAHRALQDGLSFGVPDLTDVPVVEATDGGEMTAAVIEGSVCSVNGLFEGRWRDEGAEGAGFEGFGHGAGAEDIEDYANGEGEQVCAEVEAVARFGLDWHGFVSGGGGRVHGGNVARFRRTGKGWREGIGLTLRPRRTQRWKGGDASAASEKLVLESLKVQAERFKA